MTPTSSNRDNDDKKNAQSSLMVSTKHDNLDNVDFRHKIRNSQNFSQKYNHQFQMPTAFKK